MERSERFVGIDVSKRSLDVAIGELPLERYENTYEGIDKLVERLVAIEPESSTP